MQHSDGTVCCDYCGQRAALMGEEARQPYWLCAPCDATVAAYPNSPTFKPVGRFANAKLRDAKRKAREAFDPLWRNSIKASGRGDAFRWLADELGINVKDCSFDQFDVDTCLRVVDIVQAKVPPFMRKPV